MPSNILYRARKLFSRKKYPEIVQLLESRIFQYRENFIYYYYLGLACMKIGDLGGASSYLNRADQLKPHNINCQLCIAVLELKNFKTDECLSRWLNILERDEKKKKAKTGLRLLKKGYKPEDLGNSERYLKKLLPAVRSKWFFMKYIVAVILAIMLIPSVYIITVRVMENINKESNRFNQLMDEYTEESLLKNSSAAPYFNLTPDEIEGIWEKIKNYINEYRDNIAQRELNRILLSNAQRRDREMAIMLQEKLKEPEFSTIKDNFSYEEVSGNIYLYKDCFVNWRGKLVNVIITEDDITFDLLEGYHNEKELHGIVPCVVDFAVNIKNADNVELLGKVLPGDNKFIVKVKSIHVLK